MFLNCDVVPRDYTKGTQWISQAAEQGFAPAQVELGMIYLEGFEGVPKDYVKAYAWYSITATQGHENADLQKGVIKKESLNEIMSPKQIAKGQELAAEYWEKYVVPFQKD